MLDVLICCADFILISKLNKVVSKTTLLSEAR